jgi:hypothetical protein
MITYRPSIGNNETKVGVTNDGKFFGKSTGGKVLLNLRTNDEPKSTYYKNNYTDLSNDSSWFFKSITDTDYLRGSTTYRAIYIGASERYEENEILGTITTSVSNDNGDPALLNSVSLSLWIEGFYTELTSENSLSLEDENDRYNQLSSAIWSSSISYTNTLLPGQFIKVWIRVTTNENAALVDIDNFNYIFTIGDLSIPVRKTPSRLSYSKLFKAKLNSDSIVLKETLPAQFGESNFDGIFKVIKKENYVNLFYITNCLEGDLDDYDPSVSELRLLVAKTGDNLGEYKFIDVPLTPLFNNAVLLTSDNYQDYLKVMTCGLPLTVHATDENGGETEQEVENLSISISTSGAGNYVSQVSEKLPNRKFIIDAFISTKEDINYAHIFYAELHTDYTARDILNYQHTFYKWVLKVASIDLNHINDKQFARVEYGYDNKHTSIVTNYYDVLIKDYFYVSNILMQEDLFTISGFDTQDCYFKNYKGKLLFVWEKDLILRNLNVQESLLPENEYSTFRTVDNLTQKPTTLKFSNLTQVKPTTDFERKFNTNTFNYITMGSPHTKMVDHGASSVTFELENSKIKEYNTTWSFIVSGETLATSGTQVTTISRDLYEPRSMHPVLENVYNNISAGYTYAISGSAYINNDISIFALNCQDDITEKALEVFYNFSTNSWSVSRKDNNCISITEAISGNNLPKLVPDQQSVITADIFMHEVSGGTTTEFFPGGFRINNACIKRNIISYKIFANGKLVTKGTTCSLNNVDIYQITHNPNGDFMGLISYWEVRPPVEELVSYVEALHKIHLNVVWGKLDEEKIVKSNNPLFNNFNCRRRVSFQNLSAFKDKAIIPLVLYGNSYNITKYNNSNINKEILRNVFDFNKLSLNKKSFGFFVEKTFMPIEFEVSSYDFENDILVIWLKLEGWNGEAIHMFYSDAMLVNQPPKIIYDEYYGVWKMDAFIKKNIDRFTNQKVFDIGETVVMTKKDENIYLTLINNIVRFGNSKYYKSNYFDIEFNDLDVNKQEMPKIQEFIRDTVRLFKPSYMEIRDVKSLYDYKLETNNTGDS